MTLKVTSHWVQVASLDDLWEGEMLEVEVEEEAILLVHCQGGGIKAYQGICPHQARALADGTFEGNMLTCGAHLWQFDVRNGKGINPANCQLYSYEVKVEQDGCISIAIPEGTERRYNRCIA